jgi:ATP-dependent RNA helicase DHX8/PRP22
MDPLQLPIRKYQKEIIASVRANPVTVVIGETGSGKTTQISQILEEAGFASTGVIGVTQPRRVVSGNAAAAGRSFHRRAPEAFSKVP